MLTESREFCARHDTRRELTIPMSHQQNGKAVGMSRVIMEGATVILQSCIMLKCQ